MFDVAREGEPAMTAQLDNLENATVLALVDAMGKGAEWWRTAALIEEVGSAVRLVHQDWAEPPVDHIEAMTLAEAVKPDRVEHYRRLIEKYAQRGVRLLTVLDAEYPRNLRQIYNRPPFLWVRGELADGDNRAIAIVGTRQASPEGLGEADRLARDLASAGVTVLSGLARGIDGAAHTAALAANGRTVAVMGTGIDRVYPEEHEHLAKRIVASGQGALVSQFWPTAPPTRYSFPMRNVVMSGMAVGTVVIEAGQTSGAKLQARYALDHEKRLFLVKSLVLREEWAQRAAEHRLTTVVESAEDVLGVLVELARPVEQLTLG
jgi:DNA processing protein